MQIVRDVAQGLRFLHSSKPAIMHGDLKAKNILIDARFRAKVADFGLATRTRKNGISGTPFWMAPEYLRGKTEYTTSCDIYSFGAPKNTCCYTGCMYACLSYNCFFLNSTCF